jgi:hypothetical protein
MTVKINLLEFNLPVLNSLRGIDTYNTIAGTEVTNTTQNIAANSAVLGQFIPVENQNYNGSAISISSIIEDPDGTPKTLVNGTDFIVIKDANGLYGIVFLSGGEADVTKLNQIAYDYTPKTSETLSSGGKLRLNNFWTRLTSIDPVSGRRIQIIMYKCMIADGFKFDFSSDEDIKNIEIPLTIKATNDVTRAAGNQLYSINRTVAQ